MTTVPIVFYLGLSALLFALGTVGLLIKRNLLTQFMCVELMLNAANLAFIAFAQGRPDGTVIAFFVMAVAAAEAGVGLALVILLSRHRGSMDSEDYRLLKW